MALSKEIRTILESSSLTFEEVRAFSTGLMHLTDDEQEMFAEILKENPDFIYPLYINFKAKLHAIKGGEDEWNEAIERELEELEGVISKRNVGDEIR
jgi:hypothetical protein